MRSFIKKIIGPDERLLLLTGLHWIYFVQGTLWGSCMIALGMGLDYALWMNFGVSIPLAGQTVLGFYISSATPFMTYLFGGGGVVIFFVHVIKALATEIALTSVRLIYKTGLIFVEVEEIDLVEIREESVQHGMLGRFLDYGRLRLDSRFVGDIHLPAVRHPYKLIKAMHGARARIHDPIGNGTGVE